MQLTRTSVRTVEVGDGCALATFGSGRHVRPGEAAADSGYLRAADATTIALTPNDIYEAGRDRN
jgi:hypothetical protein